jgi:hypothetical protein
MGLGVSLTKIPKMNTCTYNYSCTKNMKHETQKKFKNSKFNLVYWNKFTRKQGVNSKKMVETRKGKIK